MNPLTFRTDDDTRWGTGNGTDLTAVQVDLNFWAVQVAIDAIEAATQTTVSIDFITQPAGGNQFFVHLTNHSILGPFTIPASQWRPRGDWQPLTAYAAFDTVSDGGALYLVLQPITSAATFDPFAQFNLASVYALILSAPADGVPTDGVVGQRLVFKGGSPNFSGWENEYVRLALFVPGQPQAGSTLLQYCVTDNMQLPAGLAGSVAFSATPSTTTQSFPLFKNGVAIGSIIFNGSGSSPSDVDVSFPDDVSFVPGDIITLNAPPAPDANQANISITLLATLTS